MAAAEDVEEARQISSVHIHWDNRTLVKVYPEACCCGKLIEQIFQPDDISRSRLKYNQRVIYVL